MTFTSYRFAAAAGVAPTMPTAHTTKVAVTAPIHRREPRLMLIVPPSGERDPRARPSSFHRPGWGGIGRVAHSSTLTGGLPVSLPTPGAGWPGVLLRRTMPS